MSFLRSRRFGFLIGGLFLLVAIGAIVCFYGMRQSGTTTVVLSDGSTVKILQLTYGTNHIFSPNPLINKLPFRVGGFMKGIIQGDPLLRMQTQSARPELRIWYAYTSAGSNSSSGIWTGFLANEKGDVFGDSAVFFAPPPPNYFANSIGFEVWPRRSRTLQLHLYHRDQKGDIDRREVIPMRNSFYQDGPQWQPDTLPRTKTIGDLEVTLEKFETGYGNREHVSFFGSRTIRTPYPHKEGEKSQSSCRIHFRQTNAPANIWRVERVTLSDANGNAVTTGHMIQHNEDGGVKFGLSLWPDETAWKLACEVKRETGFAADELATFNIPIPPLNESSSALIQTNINGITVAITNIVHTPPAQRDFGEHVSGFNFTNSLQNGTYIDLISVKANGKELRHYSSSYNPTCQGYSAREFPSDAKTLDITMAVQRSRTVEFLVKPVIATTNAMAGTRR